MGEGFGQNSSPDMGPVFMYEKKGDSAVIRRCFSHEEYAVIPEQICGLLVTEVGPYCFSAHMDEKALQKEFEAGKLLIFQESAGFYPGQKQEEGEIACGAEPNRFREEMFNSPDLRQREGRSSSKAEPDKFRGTFLGQLTEKGIQAPDRLIPPLCGNKLKELVLPGSIRRVGRYCLYNCDALELLEFDSALSDWGSGVFTGCHHIKKIRLHLGEDGKSSLKQMLDEVPEAVEVEFLSRDDRPYFTEAEKDGEAGSVLMARLIFPEFYEEGVENTPARILETHVHGSGILYRNCFQNRVFDFQQYDRLFPYAVAREDFEITARLAVGRLWFPHGLLETARRQYEEYVISEFARFAELFVHARDMRGIRFLAKLAGEAHPDFYDVLTELAGKERFVEAVGFLMESRRNAGKRDKRRRTLEERRRFEL